MSLEQAEYLIDYSDLYKKVTMCVKVLHYLLESSLSLSSLRSQLSKHHSR